MSGDEYEFSGLKGFRLGPVFSAVWGDRNHEADAFISGASEAYQKHPEYIDLDRAAIGLFIVQAFTAEELTRITHAMNIWNKKKSEIEKALAENPVEPQDIPLLESDFNEQDALMIKNMAVAFPSEFVNNVQVIAVGDTNFVFQKQERLTPEQYDVLFQLDLEGELENPVYALIDEDGAIIID